MRSRSARGHGTGSNMSDAAEVETEATHDEDQNPEEDEEEEDSDDSDSDSEFSDPEGFVDDITDEELLSDLLSQRPVEDTSFDNVIVVDNAPQVGPDRLDKLKGVLKKVFGRFGTILTEYYPIDETNTFKGYFFIEYSTQSEAAEAVKTCNGYKLDKKHIFAVNKFTDFNKYAQLPENWKPPEKTEFVDHGNMRSWLLDPDSHDQYAIMYNGGAGKEKVAILYNTPQEPRPVCERERWTETYVKWSPHGTYLTTFHNQGVALWGASEFVRCGRFTHTQVQLVDFSPDEKYIVTCSNVVENPNDPQNVIVWDVKTGKKKRTFIRSTEEWPMLKWSFDGQYLAKMGDNILSIFETPSFGMLDKKSLVVRGIKGFSWSPSDHLISYWVPELQQIPSKIFITKIPSREEVATKSRHYVSECKLLWHKQGDYLCVKVDHYMTKSRKQLCSSFEIFHMRESDIPVDTIEIKENVINFALEPTGSKFAILHGDPPTRISVSFYKLEKGVPVTKIITMEKQTANNIFWCPTGQFVVLAGLKSMDGQLTFIDTADMSVMNKQEHTNVTDVGWDPTGRYVVSSVSFWTLKLDTGFIVWSFQGRLLYRNPRYMDRFCQLLWRPRPPSLLTEDEIKTIKKDFKKYQYIFEQKDRSTKTKASKELVEKRRKVANEFKTYRLKKEKELEIKRQKFAQYVRQLEVTEQVEEVEVEVALETRIDDL